MIRNHDDTHQSTRIGCLHERRSYSRAHTTPGSNVDTPIAGDTTRSRMASQKFYLWAPKGISSSVVTHAPSPPGRMRLTSRQSISPWRVARRVFRHAASSKPPAANSRRHRHGTGCAALPHPSTKLPPRKTARSDALSFEMSALEARPPTAPESWLLSGISSPPWVRSRHNLTPNITGGIRERLRTGHRPGTDSLPVGQCLDPSQSSPYTYHASADFTPGSGVDNTHWSRLHNPAGGDKSQG